MTVEALTKVLNDERCGLFLLAGLDNTDANKRQVLTIHASADLFSSENESFVRARVKDAFPDLAVRVRRHAFRKLCSPPSLEKFTEQFSHRTILHDPTGAFARAADLVALAAVMRANYGHALRSLFWRPETGALHLVLDKDRMPREHLDDHTIAELVETARELVNANSTTDLTTAFRQVSVAHDLPPGHFTPVDTASIPAAPGLGKLLAPLARISGLAAMIGIGSFAVAQAKAIPIEEDVTLMPGISALHGLTTLGENGFGQRNPFRAVGGLRLYFGNSEPELLARCFLFGHLTGKCVLIPENTDDLHPDNGNGGEGGLHRGRQRTAYGA